MSSGQSAPATAASTGAKDETALIKDAAAALQSAEKLNPRPETENAIKIINSILQKVAQAPSATSSAQAPDALLTLQKDPKQWVMPTGDYANVRHSALKQITTENVGKLQLAWQFSTGVLRGHEGAPLVIGDVMYLHTPFPNNVYALDLKDPTHKILWKYEPKQDPSVVPVMCCDTVNRGLAYGDGKIFLAQADTTLVALDAKTGKLVWSVKNGDPSKGQTSTAAPHVFKDKVFVGIAGGEFGVRGHITAYDVKDRQAGVARLFDGPGRRHADRAGQDHPSRQAGREGLGHLDLGRRSVEDRRRHHLGLVQL